MIKSTVWGRLGIEPVTFRTTQARSPRSDHLSLQLAKLQYSLNLLTAITN